jgi:hypothetical protein
VEGKVVGEGGRARRTRGNGKIRAVGGDRDAGGEERMVSKREREEKTIDAGGPRVGGGKIVGDVIEGMGIMRRVEEAEFDFEVGPSGRERSWRKSGGGGGGIVYGFNKVEVPTHKSIYVRIDGGDGINNLGVEGKVAPRFEVTVEELKGGVRGGERQVSAKLDAALTDLGERNIHPGIVPKERGAVNNNGTCTRHREVVTRDVTTYQMRESVRFARCEVCFL